MATEYQFRYDIMGVEMTEIENLIKQAKAIKKQRSKPKPKLTNRSWQEILDGQPYPHLNAKNL